MKIKKNFFRVGKMRHYFIELSDDNNLMLREIKSILKIFMKEKVKIYFTGLFHINIPDCFQVLNIGTSNYYELNELNQLDILFDKNFINFIVNLEFYLYFGNKELNSKQDVENNIANLYLESGFTECGLFFDHTIYDEAEILKHLKSI